MYKYTFFTAFVFDEVNLKFLLVSCREKHINKIQFFRKIFSFFVFSVVGTKKQLFSRFIFVTQHKCLQASSKTNVQQRCVALVADYNFFFHFVAKQESNSARGVFFARLSDQNYKDLNITADGDILQRELAAFRENSDEFYRISKVSALDCFCLYLILLNT